jgi:ankyrin repeat protein
MEEKEQIPILRKRQTFSLQTRNKALSAPMKKRSNRISIKRPMHKSARMTFSTKSKTKSENEKIRLMTRKLYLKTTRNLSIFVDQSKQLVNQFLGVKPNPKTKKMEILLRDKQIRQFIKLYENLTSVRKKILISNAIKTNCYKIVEFVLTWRNEKAQSWYYDPVVNDALELASEYGSYNVVKLLLKDSRVKPSFLDFFQAVISGHVNIVKLFIKDGRINPGKHRNVALLEIFKPPNCNVDRLLGDGTQINPAEYGKWMANKKPIMPNYYKIAKLLIDDPRINPAINSNRMLKVASLTGYDKIVKLLLKNHRVDPAASNNYAIRKASWKGHTDVVKLLLKDPRVDPSANNDNALNISAELGHIDIVKLLLKDNRVNAESVNLFMLNDDIAKLLKTHIRKKRKSK